LHPACAAVCTGRQASSVPAGLVNNQLSHCCKTPCSMPRARCFSSLSGVRSIYLSIPKRCNARQLMHSLRPTNTATWQEHIATCCKVKLHTA
jgi:hypothetical protein